MPDLNWTLVGLVLSAFCAGVMNSVAGGGTLLTFPALLAAFVAPLGPERAAALANGTSTVALLPGSFAGALGYRRELWDCRRFVVRMLLPSALGGYLGATLVSQNQRAFANLVPWLILTAAILFVVQAPLARWVKRRAAAQGKADQPPGLVAQGLVIGFQFLVAIYGGYFGAGIGILMLSALGFMGVGDIHRMNAVKTFLAATINAASVVVFARDWLVDWSYAWPLAIAAIIGGYAGARVARRLPASTVRYVVIAIAFGLAAYYFIQRYT
jgi:uncharacterized membrane protein YfcA